MPIYEEHSNVRNVRESSHYASVPDHILYAVLAARGVLPGLPAFDNPNSIYGLLKHSYASLIERVTF
jgi:hypothetical protein